jgi:hypothetical protein
MTIERHFHAMPDLPKGLNAWQAEFMKATKVNIDLLSGFNGRTHTAIVRGDVTVNGVSSQGVTGAFDAADYLRLSTEVSILRLALNELINNIK